ncbi:MAG: hypothetical protein K6G61_11925 [Solobacterium sp.]|nr:hypothetical protein [Solobacterium sp.]
MNLLKITVLSASLLMPCVPAYEAEAPALNEQVCLPAAEAEISYSDDSSLETAVYEETAADTDSPEETGLDIQYLLFLQEFRTSIHDAWTPFMEFVSTFATRYLILAVLFIYWVVNKKSGLYAIAAMCLTLAVNQLIKLTACVSSVDP